MHRFLIFSIFCLEIVFLNSLHAQDTCKCDYLASGYYQLIYEAEIAHLEGNDGLAYEKLQKAEQTCPLINQLFSQEMELYGRLLLKNKDFDKAIDYMEKLATEYGTMPFYILSVLENDSVLTRNLMLQYPAFNDSILPAIMQKCNEFYTPERLQFTAELKTILNADQEVRKDWAKQSKGTDSVAYYAEIKETDRINANRFFEIIKTQGFPNTKKYGGKNSAMLFGGISALVLHISDNFNIEEMILQYVRNGECAPFLYGTIVDRKAIITKKEEKCLYAAYAHTKDEQIADIEQVDERRMAIGMPTREMERKRNKLLDGRK